MNPIIPTLENIQQRLLWLATNMIHHANYVRPNPDESKIGGHQASSASMITLMTALYFHHLRVGDRVSVKPHASPVFHAIQYLLGNLSRDYLPQLRAYKGLQAYPSRSKDHDPVDFSTGSVGLGAVAPAFAALADQYAASHFGNGHKRRFVALVGDAELDEGNVWEAVLDPSLARLGNLLWIVDLNRQSLDRVVPGIRAGQLQRLFAESGWQVLEAKYGRRLQALFAQPNGHLLKQRIDEMPNEKYQATIRLSGAEIRHELCKYHPEVQEVLAPISDEVLPAVLQNLGGHDFEELLSCLEQSDAEQKRPSVLFAYTIKGWGLPIAGHPLNHSMLLDAHQMEDLRHQLLGDEPDEWAAFAPSSAEGQLCTAVSNRIYPKEKQPTKRLTENDLPNAIQVASQNDVSTQQTFGRVLMSLSREEALAKRMVTAAPDVSVSTNLSGWIAKVGVYAPEEIRNYEAEANHPSNWSQGPQGQHIELGISEMNLFMMLGMFGMTEDLIGEQLIPIGTVYDPFVLRGLDAFVYALYSGSKFIIAGTPSGLTLSPEGGAHQSTITPSVGMELPNLDTYEPCYAQELAWIMGEALRQCCDPENGRATYLRLSTKQIAQRPFHEAMQRIGEAKLEQQIIAGGYRLHDWRAATDELHKEYLVHIATSGAMIPEALAAAAALAAEGIPANVLNLTSPRRLFESWQQMAWGKTQPPQNGAQPFAWLIPQNERHAPIVTILDGASHTLSWLGSVFGTLVVPLGVDRFGQSGDRADLYRHYQIDATAIVDAALTALNRSGLY